MPANKLFGSRIVPDCACCTRNENPEGTPRCALFRGQTRNEDRNCPYFSYDPLLRKPDVLPPFQQFDPSDFDL